MVLYLDIVLLKEFVMDIILLSIETLVLKKKTNSLNIIIASIIGVVETLIECIIHFSFLPCLFLKIVISILMIKIVYRTKDIKKFAKEISVFYLITFSLGGMLTNLIFSNRLYIGLIDNSIFRKYSNFIIIILIFFSSIFIIFTLKALSKKIDMNNLYEIEFKINFSIIRTNIILDTGNFLKEPITGNEVVIIEKSILDKALKNSDYNLKYYLIPYTTLGNEDKVLFGIKPEYIMFRNSNIILDNVIIGIYDGKISKSGKYFGLCSTEIFQRGVE